jgi:hypothetical protein
MDLDRDQVERVLRRASDLAHVPFHESSRTSEQAVIEAAAEVGIPADAVRMSLALERVPPPPPSGRADRLVGPAHVVTDRVVRLSADEVLRGIDSLLVHEHVMRRERGNDTSGSWTRRRDAMGSVQRTLRKVSGSAQLGHLDEVSAHTATAGDQGVVVRLIAARQRERNGILIGGVIVTAVGLAGTAIAGVLLSPLGLIAAPLAVAAGAAAVRPGAGQARRSANELERLLDAVSQGAKPASLSDTVRRMVQRGEL